MSFPIVKIAVQSHGRASNHRNFWSGVRLESLTKLAIFYLDKNVASNGAAMKRNMDSKVAVNYTDSQRLFMFCLPYQEIATKTRATFK